MKQLVLILCVAFVASSYIYGQGYVITGEVQGAEGQVVSLKQIRDQQSVEVASTTVKSNKFTLKGSALYPEFCMLHIGDKGPVQFFVENSDIRIVVDMVNIEKSKVTGSKENDVFMEFVGSLEKYAQQQKQLNDSYVSLSSSSIASPDAVMKIRAQLEKLNADRSAYMISFVQKYPGKIATAFIVNNVLLNSLDVTQLNQVVKEFDAKSGQSP